MPPDRDAIMDVLRSIPDPEMPISIVDLGIVERVTVHPSADKGCVVDVDILPTFVGCPALDMIRDDIRARIVALPGVDQVQVSFLFDPPWTVDRISEAGRASLKAHGVTVPASGSKLDVHGGTKSDAVTTRIGTSAVSCPFCGSTSTHLDSPFGPTRCRMIYYCEACRNSFERIKRV